MVLSDGEILAAIEQGRIVIDPPLNLEPEHQEIALTTSALDLRLGSTLHFYKPLDEVAPMGLASPVVIDPSKPNVIPDLIKKWGRPHPIEGGYYDLPPRQFVLGATHERVSLPESGGIAARVEGKSTLARLGFVVHMTAPTIHSGFVGNIVLEMYNFGAYSIRLTHKMRVCQLIFESMQNTPLSTQTSQYLGQLGPTGDRDSGTSTLS